MPALRPALLTAVVAVLAGLALTYVTTALAGGATFLGTVRLWLVAHGSGLSVGATDVTVVPLGGTLAAGAIAVLAARWVAAHPIDEPSLFAAASGGFAGVMAGVLASVASVGDVDLSLVRSSMGAFVVTGLAAAVGYATRHGIPQAWTLLDRPRTRAVIDGAVRILVTIAVVSVALVLFLLAVHARRAGDLWAALDPGYGGGLTLLVINLLVLPTLVIWAASVLVGPGILLGADSTVDLTGSHVGELPALPALAAVPAPGEFASWVFVLGVIPLLTALIVGVRFGRDGVAESVRDKALLAAASGAVSGLTLGITAALSSGSIGPGRMAEVGPDALSVLFVAVPTLAAGAALGAVAAHYRWQRA